MEEKEQKNLIRNRKRRIQKSKKNQRRLHLKRTKRPENINYFLKLLHRMEKLNFLAKALSLIA